MTASLSIYTPRVITFDTPEEMLAAMGFHPQHDAHIKAWHLARRLAAARAASRAVQAEVARMNARLRASREAMAL